MALKYWKENTKRTISSFFERFKDVNKVRLIVRYGVLTLFGTLKMGDSVLNLKKVNLG